MTTRRASTCLLLFALVGCADTADDGPPTGPRIQTLSSARIVVGEALSFIGYNLGVNDDGAARVVFSGQFYADDGTTERVDMAFAAVADSEVVRAGETLQVLTINRFGPFSNPFHAGDRPGRFEGRVHAEIEDVDGTVTRDEDPNELTLEIGASLIIEAFEPIEAQCGAPALRALAGIPYRLQVRPVGLKATRFLYSLSQINGAPGVVEFEHRLGVPVATDTLGDPDGGDGAVIFNPVPGELQSYVSAVRVLAFDADGNSVETAVPISVHRPVEVVYGGRYELAQIYQAVPVSGCTPGSFGTRVSYSERVSETRQRSVAMKVSNDWMASSGQTRSESWKEGVTTGSSSSQSLGGSETEEQKAEREQNVTYNSSSSNEVGVSASDGESWGWNMSEGESNTEYEERMNELYGAGNVSGTVGVEAEGSVPGFAKVTGHTSTTVGIRAGGATAGTGGTSRTNRSERGFSMAGESSETRSFGSATSEARGESLTGAYSLTNRRTRSYQDESSRSESRTWDFSQGASEREVVSEGVTESEERSWTESSTTETTRRFSGFIPKTGAGIFYRQTSRFVRRAEVRAYNLCGLARHMGELQFNEWTWAPELALGDSCETTPQSRLPAATCIIEPCDP